MTCYTIHDGKDRDAWLHSRSRGVGASEVPILFGCGYSESSLLDLYARKVNAGVDRIEETEGMGWGKRLEGAIIEETASRAGAYVTRNASLFANPEHPYLVCTPDGLTADNEPVEVKNICQSVDESDWEIGIPERFNLQLQTQIAVMDAPRGLFGALLFGGRLVWGWIPRDNGLIAEIDRRAAEFWRHVLDEDPPASNGTQSARKAALAIANVLPAKELFDGEVGDFLLEWESLRAHELAAKAELEHAEKQRKAIEDKLILQMGSATEAFTTTGWGFKRTQTKRKGYTVEPKTIEQFRVIPPRTGSRA